MFFFPRLFFLGGMGGGELDLNPEEDDELKSTLSHRHILSEGDVNLLVFGSLTYPPPQTSCETCPPQWLPAGKRHRCQKQAEFKAPRCDLRSGTAPRNKRSVAGVKGQTFTAARGGM